jgi:hypothetical protein
MAASIHISYYKNNYCGKSAEKRRCGKRLRGHQRLPFKK